MKIGILTPNFYSWGPQRLIVDQIRHWPEPSDRFTIISLIPHIDKNLRRELEELNVEIISADFGSGMFSLDSLKRLRLLLKSLNLDILHTHLLRANVTGRLASLGLKYPIITTYHNTDFAHSIGSRASMVWRFILEWVTVRLKCSGIIFVSQAVSREYRWVKFFKPSKLIYNGIELFFFEQAKVNADQIKSFAFLKDRFVLLMVGRLQEQKDPILAVKMAAELKALGVPFRLILIGEGPLFTLLSQMVKTLDLSDDVLFLGSVSRMEVAQWYLRADALLLTSKMEGFAIVAAEAMAMGLPVIASSLPVLKEVIGDECGVFIDSRDPLVWAETIRSFIKNEGRRKSMSIAAPLRTKKLYSIDKNVKDLYDFLNNIT